MTYRWMVAAATERGWNGTDHNEADSYLLWCMVNEADET